MRSKKSNISALLKILGTILLIIGISMGIPWIYAEVSGETAASGVFRICVPITLALGLAVSAFFRSDRSKFGSRDGYLIVSLCWILASVAGAFPYYFSGACDSFIDSLFESTSGFTTTGATGLAEGLTSRSLLLWKALSHWLGGMGILVFVISILPALGISGQFIVRAEAPGPVYTKTTTRITNSARMLYVTYFSFTVLEFLLLMVSGKMDCYDAVITTLGCVSTGGLLPSASGIAVYQSSFVEMVIAVFCLLSSVNYVLYYYIVTGHISQALRDVELRGYLTIILSACVLCSINLVYAEGYHALDALRESFFQTTCMVSTAGYAKATGLVWPAACQMVFLILSLTGGCSASTAGGIKVVRIQVMFKLIARNCIRRIHPRSVVAVKLGSGAVSAPVVSSITAFLLTFAGLTLFSGAVLSLQGFDMETNLTTAVAMLSNTGTSFIHGMAVSNFSFYHPILKVFLCILMIAGRLEIFTILILFTRNFWGRNR